MKKIFLLSFLYCLSTCTKDKYLAPDTSCYPDEVSKIMVNKCATSGCHNSNSAANAAGLDYTSWETMFRGGKNGSSVIPYSPEFSYLLYFCNTDTNLGIVLPPTMPYLQEPLSREEYLTLRDWIANGAPDCNGKRFSDNPDRKKFYVCMQPCNQVAVFDAETRVIMRYINVGNGNGGPHQLRITPDGKYWCLVFNEGNILQVFRTTDDTEVASIILHNGSNATWNTVAFTNDSKYAFVSALSEGIIARADLTTMTSELIPVNVPNAHGTYVSPDDSTLYVTSQMGGTLYKIHLEDTLNPWSYDPVTLNPQTQNVHEIIFSPDGTKYFLSCDMTIGKVGVYNASNDQFITSIEVGKKPQEFSISEDHQWLFVSCQEDISSPGCSADKRGSVYIIDYTTNSIVSSVHPGFQPHGIAVDDDHDVVYVANLNYDGGPAPHHVSECGGRNGYISVIDMSTQQLLNVSLSGGSQYVYKNEVLQYPYFVSYRK